MHVGLVCFKTSQELGMDSVVHFRAKLMALVSSRGKQCCMLSKVTSNRSKQSYQPKMTYSKYHSYTSVSLFFFCLFVVCLFFVCSSLFLHTVVVIADDPEREIHLYL